MAVSPNHSCSSLGPLPAHIRSKGHLDQQGQISRPRQAVDHLLAVDLAEVGQDVVGRGVSQVIHQVLVGTLVGQDGLGTIAEHGKHSQTAVLDLVQLQLLHVSLGPAHVEQVEEGATCREGKQGDTGVRFGAEE